MHHLAWFENPAATAIAWGDDSSLLPVPAAATQPGIRESDGQIAKPAPMSSVVMESAGGGKTHALELDELLLPARGPIHFMN